MNTTGQTAESLLGDHWKALTIRDVRDRLTEDTVLLKAIEATLLILGLPEWYALSNLRAAISRGLWTTGIDFKQSISERQLNRLMDFLKIDPQAPPDTQPVTCNVVKQLEETGHTIERALNRAKLTGYCDLQVARTLIEHAIDLYWEILEETSAKGHKDQPTPSLPIQESDRIIQALRAMRWLGDQDTLVVEVEAPGGKRLVSTVNRGSHINIQVK